MPKMTLKKINKTWTVGMAACHVFMASERGANERTGMRR